MNTDSPEICAICGQTQTVHPLPGTGQVCDDCAMAGRFLGSTGALRLSEAARRLPELSPAARQLANPIMNEAARLSDKQMNSSARKLLKQRADENLRLGRPLLAAHLLMAALPLPGDSSGVYIGLGDTAAAMDCPHEASQHYKTAGWLGMQLGDRAVVERSLDGLERVTPEDNWLDKGREWLGGQDQKDEPLCGFCGKPASEAGTLIQGPQAAICPACLQRLSSAQQS